MSNGVAALTGPGSRPVDDPYVSRVLTLLDKDLFSLPPDELSAIRADLRRDCLLFFSRRSVYYSELFQRVGIDIDAPGIADLARLAVPSDMLRGDGQRRFLLSEMEDGGETYTSSGTTGRSPVRIYRSPLDLEIMVKANTALFEHLYGSVLEDGKGIALFMAAPELRKKLSFVAFVAKTLERKGIELLYGMDLKEGAEEGKPWTKMEPNTGNIMRFLRSRKEPKLFFTAPAGVHLLTKKIDSLTWSKKLIQRLATGTPPIRLGRGGMIVTGGGSKGFDDLPPYDDIVANARNVFTAQTKGGEDVPTPFMDVLGMTETLTALIDRYGEVAKVPYPLSDVFLLDPRTLAPATPGQEGLIGLFNPFVTSWLECFYPGDIMVERPSSSYYGREFVFRRRLTVKEGWNLQRACGASMEELMRGGA